MPSVAVNSFGGSVPRVERHLLPQGSAARAVDCRLDSGALASWNEPLPVAQTPYINHGVWLEKPDCSGWAFAEVPQLARLPSGDCEREAAVAHWDARNNYRLVTGIAKYPVAFLWDGSNWSYQGPLKPPPALSSPTVTSSNFTEYTKDGEYRHYAYQVKNQFGQWSALSPATGVPVGAFDSVSLALPSSTTSHPEGIHGVRWYRSIATVGGSMPTLENTMRNVMDTQWIRFSETNTPGGGYIVTDGGLLNEDLYEALEEDIVVAPPDSLQGITAVESMSCFAGYSGKRLYFSENNSPGNWPHYLTLKDNICGIVESNGLLYVATDGHPYVVNAVADCEGAGCRDVMRLPLALPMAGCGLRKIVALPQGAAYVSRNGLVGISGASSPSLISNGLYAPKQWHELVPESMKLVTHEGKLFCFGQRGSFALTLAGGASSEWALDSHTEISDVVDDAFTNRVGEMFIRKGAQLSKWNAGLTKRPHRWESPEFVVPAEVNLGAGHVRLLGGPEQLQVFVDGRTALSRQVLSSRQIRLPNWAVGTRWSFTLTGTASVNLVSLASSMGELSA